MVVGDPVDNQCDEDHGDIDDLDMDFFVVGYGFADQNGQQDGECFLGEYYGQGNSAGIHDEHVDVDHDLHCQDILAVLLNKNTTQKFLKSD